MLNLKIQNHSKNFVDENYPAKFCGLLLEL